MRKNISLVSFVCLPLLACGGSDNNSKIKVVDAKKFMDGSAGSAACLAPATYANLGSGARGRDIPAGSNAQAQTYQSLLNSTDYFFMVLAGNAMGGAWMGSNKVSPAVVDLANLPGNLLLPELDIYPMAKFGSDNHLDPTYLANESYVAFSGTVNYTAAGGSAGTHLTGTLTDVQFDHVIQTGTGFQDPGDGCTATIASAAVDVVLTAAPFSGAGSFEIQPPAGWAPHLSARHF
ncbi:hypothetical protein BH11MYX1_BH11MYX1_42630 [soil metagenome]